LVTRLLAEFVVIVLGVLIALAADRWNQQRSDAGLEAAFIERFIAEIRADSLSAERYLSRLPETLAAQDSLLKFVNGATPPSDLPATTLAAVQQMRLDAPDAWTELQAAHSITLIRSREAREAISVYYGAQRPQTLENWARVDRRGRDPFFDAVYRTGIYRLGSVEEASTNREEEAFRTRAGMHELLLALGSGHYFQRIQAETVVARTGAALRVLAKAQG